MPSQKLCLPCARRKLAKQPPKPCGACALLNVDPFAQVRANYAKPGPLWHDPTPVAGGGSTLTEAGFAHPIRQGFSFRPY